MQCPGCGTESAGAFCPQCGQALGTARCRSCSAELTPGANFCTQCGTAVRAASSRAPWLVAGFAAVVLAGAAAFALLREEPATPPPAGLGVGMAGATGAPPFAGAAPGPLTGTPREQADRLFNRVMEAQETGDTAQARFFVPMAVQAYQMAGELDTDGLFHLGLLQITAGDPAGARATADRILATEPDHLLALYAAGYAAQVAGDDAAAREHFTRFLAAYDTESARPLPEYRDHAAILPEYRRQAQQATR